MIWLDLPQEKVDHLQVIWPATQWVNQGQWTADQGETQWVNQDQWTADQGETRWVNQDQWMADQGVLIHYLVIVDQQADHLQVNQEDHLQEIL